MTPEGRVKAAIKREFTRRGVWYFMPATGGYGKSGIPDFVACLRGAFLAVEAKSPGKRESGLTELQRDRLTEIKDAGGHTLVCDDVSQLITLLDSLEGSWNG